MQVEKFIPEARLLRELLARAQGYWMSSALGITTYNSQRYGNQARPFQGMLQDAQRQGMTLKEFEQRLARMRTGLS